jgi:biopolymer transport protein ExbB
MGLIVAIPAIVAYTISLRKVERILTKFDVEQEQKNN